LPTPAAIQWRDNQLELLDQRLLPTEIRYLRFDSAAAVADAIRDMVVRGAPAIGITAAYGMALAARSVGPLPSVAAWTQALSPARHALADSRPTAVNLFWALARADQTLEQYGNGGDVAEALLQLAHQLLAEDLAINQRIGDHGAALIAPDSLVYTHCNAGALATGGYGTALGVIRSAHAGGKLRGVIAGETRPWLQGARLTTWELMQDGIDVSLATEGAAGHLMRSLKPSWVIIGADRIAANGDVANKIGSYNLAILARHHGVKFMVAAPISTFDPSLDGDDIPIEQRPGEEITHSRGAQVAPSNCISLNPAFDVTPASLIDAIVTEFGVIHSPCRESVATHLQLAKE